MPEAGLQRSVADPGLVSIDLPRMKVEDGGLLAALLLPDRPARYGERKQPEEAAAGNDPLARDHRRGDRKLDQRRIRQRAMGTSRRLWPSVMVVAERRHARRIVVALFRQHRMGPGGPRI